MTVFHDRDTTIAHGFQFLGHHYDCHRFYDHLAYGRRGDAEDGEGIAIYTFERQSTKKPVFALITYGFPTLSAKAVPQLQEFCNTHVAVL